MIAQKEFGFDKDRFTNLNNDQFDCPICSQVVKDPRECTGCGSLYCSNCIDDWFQKNKICPNRCDPTKNKIQPIGKALSRIYNDLDIKCSNFNECKKIVKITDINTHERLCKQPKCINYEMCQSYVNEKYSTQKVCEPTCLLFTKIKNCGSNQKQIFQEIQAFWKEFASASIVQSQINPNPFAIQYPVLPGQQIAFKWSTKNHGNGIELTNGNSGVWLKETAYMFRTVITDTPLMNGCHYWEIIADERTENELKIGIVTKQDFNYNTAFCDFEYGYAFYGLGQLRHNSNASGPQYGKRFKKEGVLGIFLNMNKGQLSFALNGEYFGIGFQNDALKKGPIFAAVSLLHCAGCKLETGKAIPSYFPQ